MFAKIFGKFSANFCKIKNRMLREVPVIYKFITETG